jgi:type I restriction enzyme S subunit
MTKILGVKKLAEVCEIKPQKKEARERLSDDDFVSFVPMEDLGILTKDFIATKERPLKEVSGSYTYFADNDVLLAKITPCFENGKIGIARNLKNGVGFGSSEFIVFRSRGELIPDYLYYFLIRDQFRKDGKKVMTGAVGHKRVPKDFIETQEIPLPFLPEQKRIVAILDEVFTDVAKAKAIAEKNRQNARDVFDSYLQTVFENKDGAWELVKLSELATDITDGDHLPPPKSPTGIPFITISDIDKETHQINFSNTFKVSNEYFKKLKANRKPKNGDVLYTVTGSFGIPVIVDSNFEFCFQRHIGLIRPTIQTNTRWLYYLILSPQVFKQTSDGAIGTAQKTVSLKVLRNFLVPKMPLPEQQRIVIKLDELSAQTKKLEAIYQQKFSALEELKQSVLSKAFSGQLH